MKSASIGGVLKGYLQVRVHVDGMAACPFKFNVGAFGGAAEGRHQRLSICRGLSDGIQIYDILIPKQARHQLRYTQI